MNIALTAKNIVVDAYKVSQVEVVPYANGRLLRLCFVREQESESSVRLTVKYMPTNRISKCYSLVTILHNRMINTVDRSDVNDCLGKSILLDIGDAIVGGIEKRCVVGFSSYYKPFSGQVWV